MKNLRFFSSSAVVLCGFLSLLLSGCAGSTPSGSGSSQDATGGLVTVTTVAPAILPAGSATTTITVTGTNFVSSSIVQVAGVSAPTVFVSATQLQATVSANQLINASLLSIAVLNGSTTSAAGSSISLAVENPAPVLSSFSPVAFSTGVTGIPIIVAGTGFVPTSGAQINGTSRPTTYVSPTQLSVALTTADLAVSGSLSLKIVNPAPGGGASSAASIPINNALPSNIVLNPSTAIVGASATTIGVAGSGFFAGSIVSVNGSARLTAFVDAGHLTFTLTAADQVSVANLAITVTNPAPGGGTSLAASLSVALPTSTPVISALSPTQLILGSPATYVLVMGTGFTNRSVVQWNGSSLVTSYMSPTMLYATVSATLMAALGTGSMTVMTPTATPSTSNALSIAVVVPPTPTVTSISPNFTPIGTATTITINGANFTAGSTVSFNGTALASTYSNSNNLTAQIPSSLVSLPGNGSITVTTPAPGGGTSAAQSFTSYIPITNNSMVYNSANGLLYLSVPSSAGAPYGNSIVSVDPATGAIGTPIAVGSEPNKLAISSDGKILWVGLDGAAAVRQVDLTTGIAGLQFPLNGNAGTYANPLIALALAALPGSPNSVIVSTNGNVAIFDNGVRRGPAPTSIYLYNSGYALQVDGSKSEIYVAGSNSYYVYTYASSGVTLRTTAATGAYANTGTDDLQAIGGRIYTNSGHAYDVESGALLGTFYSSGTTVANGPIVADVALNKAFILDSSTGYGSNQIQTFNTDDYTSGPAVIPVNGISTAYAYGSPSRMIRWGSNGLAFRASNGVFSFRSNLVKDLSSTKTDLGVTIATTGGNTTGSNSTYTATIANAGPSGATYVSFTALIPSTGVLISATPAQGSCSSGAIISCNLGSLANGASTTVAFVVQQTAAGASALTAQVTGPETDNSLTNNQATGTVNVTGNTYNVAPAITSILPASVLAGSIDTTLTVTGTGFSSASTVLWNGSPLSTAVSSSTQLVALIPSANITTLGWASVSVSTPAPGGGVSTVLPFSIYNVITLGVNHIIYDPFTRKIYASVGSGSSTVTGNSIVAITPETGAIGAPVSIGSQPNQLALSSNGRILYTILSGSNSVARFNMLTQQADFSFALPASSSAISPRGLAVQPGNEDTIALDISSWDGLALYDFNPTTQSATIRGAATGPYTGSSLQFLNAANLFSDDLDTSGATFNHYTVTPAGFTYYNYSQYTTSTLNRFGAFKINGGLAFANNGGAADPTTTPATQLGVYPSQSVYSYNQIVAPDTSLGRIFFLGNTSLSTYYGNGPDGILAYNQKTFMPTNAVSLNMAVTEGNNISYNGVDLIRWGQDGLAALTSGGHIYIMRGPVVVPQLLNHNSAASLTAASPANIGHGTGNTIITITGSGFVQGAAVTWNGSYRTTTWVDSSHLIVAIPASDLASAGSAALAVTNPGGTASGALTFTIN